MNFSITARHIEIDESVKDYLKKRLNKLKKYFDKKEVNIHVVFIAEKERRSIEISINHNGNVLHGQETTNDMYTSIDKVVDKLECQLKKYKEKTQKKPRVLSKITSETLSTEIQKNIKRKKQILKPMTLEKAINQLEQTSSNFLIFTDPQTETINVLYRCKDGSYELIESSL